MNKERKERTRRKGRAKEGEGRKEGCLGEREGRTKM
jgi:hypothetical protein